MNKRCRPVIWNGEERSIAGWARHLGTTRDKIRTRIKLGLRLDADSIDGTYRPIVRPKNMTTRQRAAHVRAVLGRAYTVEVQRSNVGDRFSVSWVRK